MIDEDDPQLKYIRERVDDIHEILTGNGDPQKGLILRVDRLEQVKNVGAWALGVLFVALIGFLFGIIHPTKIETGPARTSEMR